MIGSTTPVPAVVDVVAARRRLERHLATTPLRRSAWLSARAGADIYLKLEIVQPGGSFKIRGALNALLAAQHRAEAAHRHAPTRVVTASAGNHGRSLAMAARQVGARAVVFTPATAPATKKAAIRDLGAELRDHCADYDAAEREALAFGQAEGIPFVSAYNDADVIAGAGTMGLEIVERLPGVEVVILPLGGGGLASGVGLALKAAAPRARVIGVEVDASTPFTTGLARGHIVEITPHPTLADGLAGNLQPDAITFPLVQRVVDEVVVITEAELRAAIAGICAEEHLVAEGAGAAAVGAVLAGRVQVADRQAAVVVTGANIDAAVLARVLGADSERSQSANRS
jgi:threonine dehydratase